MGKKIAILLAIAAALTASLPNWYGQWKTPAGAIFLWSGFPWDSNQYFAFMRTGYRGDWLMTNLLTSEPHPPVLLMPFYVALGRAAAWYRDYLTWREGQTPPVYRTIPLVYNDARLLLTLVLFLLVYWLAAHITTRRARRLWIVAFAAFGGGVAWGQVISTESSVMSSCILFPNFIASLIFYVVTCGGFVLALKHDSASSARGLSAVRAQGTQPPTARRTEPAGRGLADSAGPGILHPSVLAALGGLGLGFTHPFDIPPLAATGAGVLVCRWFQTRRFPFALFAACMAFAVFAGVGVLYEMSLMWRIPDFRAIYQGNVMRWRPWWGGLALLEAYLAVALLGAAFLYARRRRPQSLFVLIWVAAGVAMIHVPFQFQRRMIEGLPIALAFAAPSMVEGLLVRPALRLAGRKAAFPRGRIRLVRHIAYCIVLLILMPKTLWILYDRSVLTFGHPKDYYYAPLAEAKALEWLSRNSDWHEVVWASYWRGNRVPFLSGNRVFFGHGIMTVRAQEKRQWTNDLFAFRLPVSEFRRIVREYGVDYVFWTVLDRAQDPRERDFALYDPETLGAPVYDDGFAKIFKIRREPGAGKTNGGQTKGGNGP